MSCKGARPGFVGATEGRCKSYKGHALMLQVAIHCIVMPLQRASIEVASPVPGAAKGESQSCKPLTSELQRTVGELQTHDIGAAKDGRWSCKPLSPEFKGLEPKLQAPNVGAAKGGR
jgi:hypothetical protein